MLVLLLFDELVVLVRELVKGLLDCLHVISQDVSIRQLFDTALHPHHAIIVIVFIRLPLFGLLFASLLLTEVIMRTVSLVRIQLLL